jgi:hypothetical protein
VFAKRNLVPDRARFAKPGKALQDALAWLDAEASARVEARLAADFLRAAPSDVPKLFVLQPFGNPARPEVLAENQRLLELAKSSGWLGRDYTAILPASHFRPLPTHFNLEGHRAFARKIADDILAVRAEAATQR